MFFLWLAGLVALPFPAIGQVASAAGQILTLDAALAKAFESSSLLAAARQELAIRSAELTQAGLLPNPRISYEVENFSGDHEFTGTRSLEQTARISQELELGGKRGRRKALAGIRLDAAGSEYRAAALELAAGVKSAFYTLLAAQRLDSLAGEKVRLAHEVYNAIGKRVEAGKVSPVELNRAGIVLSRADIETGKFAAELAAARQGLAATWDGREVDFERVEGDFELLEPPAELAELLAGIEGSPALEISRQNVAARRAEATLARAERFPDLELTGGIKDAREAGSRGFVAEIGIPLPLFNRNQGNSRAAEQAVTQAELTSGHVQTGLVLSLAATHAELTSAHREAVSLRDRVVTGAESVFAAIRIGYAEGKFGYLELLDAQRSLFEARGSYLEALKRYHLARTALDRLLGRGIEQDLWRDSHE